MRLLEMIKLIGLDKEAKFIPYQYGDGKKRNTLFINDEGISFWYEEEVARFKECDDENLYYDTQCDIEKYVKIYKEDRRWEIAYAVYSLLFITGRWKQMQDKSFDAKGYAISNTKKYVELIVDKIRASLEFDQIKEMSNLIELIKNDDYYYLLCFNVTEYDYAKNTNAYKNYHVRKQYTFGNLTYHEACEVVNISLYNDYVELHHERSTFSIDREIKNRSTTESEIIAALGMWESHYW